LQHGHTPWAFALLSSHCGEKRREREREGGREREEEEGGGRGGGYATTKSTEGERGDELERVRTRPAREAGGRDRARDAG
jgi:hypothetical protein